LHFSVLFACLQWLHHLPLSHTLSTLVACFLLLLLLLLLLVVVWGL
jgi:hypothetical protein